jgi:hypothetical protein
MRAPLVVLALVASLALVAAGCGGGDEEEASGDATVEWADGLCGAFDTWMTELESIQDSLSDPSSLSLDDLRTAAEDANAATETFVDDVRALGPLETDAESEIESSVQSLTDTIDAEKAKIEDAVDDAGGITGAISAASAVLSSLSTIASSFQSTVSDIEAAGMNGEIESAFREADSCDELESSTD